MDFELHLVDKINIRNCLTNFPTQIVTTRSKLNLIFLLIVLSVQVQLVIHCIRFGSVASQLVFHWRMEIVHTAVVKEDFILRR